MNVLGRGSEPERIIGKLGSPYSLVYPGASIKMYPCGSLCQPSMDSLLEMVLEEDLKQDDVQEIRVRAGPNILELLRYSLTIDGARASLDCQASSRCIEQASANTQRMWRIA